MALVQQLGTSLPGSQKDGARGTNLIDQRLEEGCPGQMVLRVHRASPGLGADGSSVRPGIDQGIKGKHVKERASEQMNE